MSDEEEVERCAWCDCPLEENEGFEFEPDPGCVLKAGIYCSAECLISAA